MLGIGLCDVYPLGRVRSKSGPTSKLARDPVARPQRGPSESVAPLPCMLERRNGYPARRR
jgi:hypothetical protein